VDAAAETVVAAAGTAAVAAEIAAEPVAGQGRQER